MSANPVGSRAIILALAALTVLWWGCRSRETPPPSPDPLLLLSDPKETRPTLSPSLFDGKVALAYQAAQDYPRVLDNLHCYCGCDRTAGHKSLLSCYTDYHGAS